MGAAPSNAGFPVGISLCSSIHKGSGLTHLLRRTTSHVCSSKIFKCMPFDSLTVTRWWGAFWLFLFLSRDNYFYFLGRRHNFWKYSHHSNSIFIRQLKEPDWTAGLALDFPSSRIRIIFLGPYTGFWRILLTDANWWLPQPPKGKFPMCSSVNIMQAQHVRFNVHVESDYTLCAKAASLPELCPVTRSYSAYTQKPGELSIEHRSDLCART